MRPAGSPRGDSFLAALEKEKPELAVLTFKEYELLRLFLSSPGTAFTREKLLSDIRGVEYFGETRTVDVHIRTLRQKIGRPLNGLDLDHPLENDTYEELTPFCAACISSVSRSRRRSGT